MVSFYEKFLNKNEWQTKWQKREFLRNPKIIQIKLKSQQQKIGTFFAIVNKHTFLFGLIIISFSKPVNSELICWYLGP